MLWKTGNGGCCGGGGLQELRPLLHLLIPLCVHWIAEEMTVSVLVDVTIEALCSDDTTCSLVIFINGLQQTVVGIFKMFVLPVLGQLSDEYGRKPLLLLIVSTSIFPFATLAVDRSKGFVYAYYVLRTISHIISQGSIFFVSVAYAADVVELGKRAFAFTWITGLYSASHVLGNLLARFLPEEYIFYVASGLLLFSPVYMYFFLQETVQHAPRQNQELGWFANALRGLYKRYKSMREAAVIVLSSRTLRGISLVSFFYQMGITGISNVLLYYLEAAFGFTKNQLSEILMMVEAGSIVSQLYMRKKKHGLKVRSLTCLVEALWELFLDIALLVLPIINPLVGEKVVLCIALLAAIAHALFYGLAWASWVPYLGASFGVIYVLVDPSTYTIISKASRPTDQGKAQGFVAGIQAIASFLSPLAMTPLTAWFISASAPFDCKGFSIVCASLSMVVAFIHAYLLKPEDLSSHFSAQEDIEGDQEAPLLRNSD